MKSKTMIWYRVNGFNPFVKDRIYDRKEAQYAKLRSIAGGEESFARTVRDHNTNMM